MLFPRKFQSLAVVSTLCVLLVAGCSRNPSPAEQGSITIVGSTSVQPVSEVLAEKFMQLHPGVRINVQGGGSTAGITSVQSGAAEIGASSRELKSSEKNLHETVIALDGIAVVVHPRNPVSSISLGDIRRIYAGQVTNWSELGGPDAQITAVTREAGSGTRGAFEEIVMGADKIADSVIVQDSTGAVRTTVSQDPNAIGYISLASVNQEVKPLAFEGVMPSPQTVRAGTYRVSRPFIYVTKEPPTGLVKAYIDFVLGPDGQRIVEAEGLIPVRSHE